MTEQKSEYVPLDTLECCPINPSTAKLVGISHIEVIRCPLCIPFDNARLPDHLVNKTSVQKNGD